MKKILGILVILTFLCAASALAENLAGMSDEELTELYRNVLSEMESRGLPADPEVYPGRDAVADRVREFFVCWSRNDVDGMLKMCDSGWKAVAEDPRTELFRILANRTPRTLEIERTDPIAGEGPDGLTYFLVTVTSMLDRNNGTAPGEYRFRLLVREEGDGLWYIHPDGLINGEKAEEEPLPEPTPEPADPAAGNSGDPILYYQPAGGEYYHLDPYCKRVNPRFLPLQDSFTYAELDQEPYRDLKPCEICGAPPRP